VSLCAACHRLAVAEGQIPKYCSTCDPPRLREPPSPEAVEKRMRDHYRDNPPENAKN
jgi:hypothetical protein